MSQQGELFMSPGTKGSFQNQEPYNTSLYPICGNQSLQKGEFLVCTSILLRSDIVQ